MSELDPSRIMEIGTGYWRSKVLLSAVGLGLFSELAKAPLARREIQEAFGLKERPAADFLDGLVSMGLLARDGDGDAAALGTRPRARIFSTAAARPISAPSWSSGRRAISASGPT